MCSRSRNQRSKCEDLPQSPRRQGCRRYHHHCPRHRWFRHCHRPHRPHRGCHHCLGHQNQLNHGFHRCHRQGLARLGCHHCRRKGPHHLQFHHRQSPRDFHPTRQEFHHCHRQDRLRHLFHRCRHKGPHRH